MAMRPRGRFVALAIVVLAQGVPAGAGDTLPPGAPVARFAIGTPATAADIEARNIDIMPDGEGLPAGSGSVAEGAALYARQCRACHGDGGQGGSAAALAGAPAAEPATLAAERGAARTVGNYWPYATTLFDYTRRAMPQDRPGSLTNSEVYALTAYILHLNEMLPSDARLDARTLPRIRMPAARFFRSDERSGAEAPATGSTGGDAP